MEKKSNFFTCGRCHNLIGMINPSGGVIYCCGAPMENMEPKYADTGAEKHRPIVQRSGDEITVCVGEKSHPMTAEHAISWVALITDLGHHRKLLIPGEEPVAYFVLKDEKPIAVYSYCNLHGLWKAQI